MINSIGHSYLCLISITMSYDKRNQNIGNTFRHWWVGLDRCPSFKLWYSSQWKRYHCKVSSEQHRYKSIKNIPLPLIVRGYNDRYCLQTYQNSNGFEWINHNTMSEYHCLFLPNRYKMFHFSDLLINQEKGSCFL